MSIAKRVTNNNKNTWEQSRSNAMYLDGKRNADWVTGIVEYTFKDNSKLILDYPTYKIED